MFPPSNYVQQEANSDCYRLNFAKAGSQNQRFELCTTLLWPEHGLQTLRLMDNGEQYCDFILDADNRRILFVRSHALPTDGDSVRELAWEDEKKVELQILADNSSLELFINGGEYVMSARIFTPEDATAMQLIGKKSFIRQAITIWQLG